MYIGIDIGGTNIRIVGSKTLENPSLSNAVKLTVVNNYDKDLQSIVSSITEFANGDTIDAIGCGIPATFSDDKQTVLIAPNLPSWNNKNFVSDLENAFHCKVSMENDDTISALAEAKYGHGIGKDFVYITWGTGFGGAKVEQTNGKVQVNQFEAGHQIIQWENGRLCGCGQTGCAEAYVGGGNIEKYYYKKADELTSEEWDEVTIHLANTLLNIIVFNPTNLIILGGGVAINQKDKVEIAKKKIEERLKIFSTPEILVTQLGDELGLYGALALLK